MSTLVAARPYSHVFDAQKHYRTLLQCTARPGTIGQLDDVSLDVPAPLNRATALIALALFNADSSFYLAQAEAAAMNFIRHETAATQASAEQAEFLLFFDAKYLDGLNHARQGSLAYPDLGATDVVQVEAISPAPLPGCLRLTLTGPGIEVETVVFVVGAAEALFATLRELNAEFPMGVDTFLTCDSLSAGPCVMALPRTTRVQWERI